MDLASSVEKIFQGRLFRIPEYQRGYAWSERHWEDFLDDLDLLEPDKIHYTGTIVLRMRTETPTVLDSGGRSYASYDVVDGQQRLTTIVLLLDQIVRELGRSEPDRLLAGGIRDSYVASTDLTGQPLWKLHIHPDDDAFFADVVMADEAGIQTPDTGSRRQLLAARGYFRDYLAAKRTADPEDFRAWLLGLYEKVCLRLRLVPYEVADAADVGVIFEVMNDRGKPLTDLEKVKNYLLYLSSKLTPDDRGLAERINSTWANVFRKTMQAGGGNDAEDQLLRSHWFMAYAPQPRAWDGTASIKARFSLRENRHRRADFVSDLHEYARSLNDGAIAYAEIMAPGTPGAFGAFATDRSGAVEGTQRLHRLRTVATFLPLLMAFRLRHADDAAAFMRVLDLCEKFAFRVYRLLGARSDAGQTDLVRLAHEVYHRRITANAAIEALTERVIAWSPPRRIEAALADDAQQSRYGWGALRYFLYEYESHVAGRRDLRISWADLERRDKERTVEHILPQNPADPYWHERFSPDERVELTHDLGNLCLTLDNSAYGRKPFPLKRGTQGQDGRCYANSTVFQELELARLEDWTPEALEARRARILTWARGRWDVVPLSPVVPVAMVDEEA